MPSLSKITAPAWSFPYGRGVTLYDLAYEEYCRSEKGEACNHVEAYFAQLVASEPPASKAEIDAFWEQEAIDALAARDRIARA